MKKRDAVVAALIGELTSWYFVLLFRSLAPRIIWFLPVVFPLLSVFCLWLAFLLGKKFLFVFQAAKFLLMGTLTTLVDLAILNVLILISGTAVGFSFSLFKGISFIFATCAKYFGDKLWVFEKKEMIGLAKEFSQFFLVTLGGLLINVSTASLLVNSVGPKFGFSLELWANFGAIVAAFTTVIWNFLGYKFIVFKK